MLATQTGGAEHAGGPVAALLDTYRVVRRVTETLAAPLSPEDQTPQSMEAASPVKWHRAHTTWFFETFLLQERVPNYQADADYRVLFNSYYNGIGQQYHRPHRGLITRPGVQEVADYRQRVDEAVCELLQGDPQPRDLQVVTLGLHHEQQHQELLLTDLKHLFGHNPLRPCYRPRPQVGQGAAGSPQTPARLRFHESAGGITPIGHRGKAFAYDNEGPHHQVLLQPHSLAERLVSEGEYLAFMQDGGYRRPELWLSAGWDAVQCRGWQAPLYWHAQGDGWQRFTLHGLEALQPGEPVCHVSFYEADAYARWAGARLPSEFEWEAADLRPRPADGAGGPTGLHPSAASDAEGAEAPGQAFGACWQWTRSDYAPYPGFAPAAGAVGEYNGKFMSGQYVLRGSSCVTPAGHGRPTYRNFYPPDARWQFSGIRLAKDLT